MGASLITVPAVGQNFIGGRWSGIDGDVWFEQRNPANLGEVTGRWPASTAREAERAIGAANDAFSAWSSMTVHDRADVLRAALGHLVDRAAHIESVIVAENGKTRSEAKTEVASAIREMSFQIEEGIRQFGEDIPSSRAGLVVLSRRVPIGVAVLIAPWNFPLNVPTRKVVPAVSVPVC